MVSFQKKTNITHKKNNLSNETSKETLKAFIKSFLMPTLVGKSLVLYFGIQYSNYPGDGYGYGLIASLAYTFVSLVYFAYKFKDYEDL